MTQRGILLCAPLRFIIHGIGRLCRSCRMRTAFGQIRSHFREPGSDVPAACLLLSLLELPIAACARIPSELNPHG